MTKLIAAPCIAEFPIAEFPVISSAMNRAAHQGGLSTVPLAVAYEWLVHEFGEDELVKVAGLPVSVIHSIYPESEGVAFFSLARGTTILSELQAVFDAMVKAMLVEDSKVLSELHRVKSWRLMTPTGVAFEDLAMDLMIDSPEVSGFHSDVVWVIKSIVYGSSAPQSSAWVQVLELALFVCAPLMVRVECRSEFVRLSPSWEPVFTALGLNELWVTASERMQGWGRR